MKANADVAGAAMQGQRGDPNSMEFSNYLFSSGGNYLDKDGKVCLEQPGGTEGLELYVDNIHKRGPEGCAIGHPRRYLPPDVRRQGMEHVTYWWMLPQVGDKTKCPNVSGKVALGVMPGGHGESGGWGWAIPKNQEPRTAGRSLGNSFLGSR